ncbi:MAG: AmmeMemoRadiSam system protein B [Candidatus Margulisiibacteriota bacterium]
MSNVIYGIIAPHPPIIVPEIGGARIAQASSTRSAMEEVSKKAKSLKPDVLVIITPHGDISATTVHVYSGPVLEGDFSAFGDKKVKLKCKGEPVLGHKTVGEAKASGLYAAEVPESFLDHGVLVPYYFLKQAGLNCTVLPIAVSLASLKELFEVGRALSKAALSSGKKIVVVASSDMSHKLTQDAPGGYSARGKEFDDKLVELVKKDDRDDILSFDPVLAEAAGQDALWSIAILLGALDGSALKSRVLSYEGPFGVGYMVAEYR